MTLPAVHNIRPKVYIFLGVRMKILLTRADTGGQFELIEGLENPVLNQPTSRVPRMPVSRTSEEI
jgi:hypothetical protein